MDEASYITVTLEKPWLSHVQKSFQVGTSFQAWAWATFTPFVEFREPRLGMQIEENPKELGGGVAVNSIIPDSNAARCLPVLVRAILRWAGGVGWQIWVEICSN